MERSGCVVANMNCERLRKMSFRKRCIWRTVPFLLCMCNDGRKPKNIRQGKHKAEKILL